jgi:hypothetical protein
MMVAVTDGHREESGSNSFGVRFDFAVLFPLYKRLWIAGSRTAGLFVDFLWTSKENRHAVGTSSIEEKADQR